MNGVWGTVCDDAFDSNNNGAKVVCRSLGKSWYATTIPFLCYLVSNIREGEGQWLFH